MMISAIYKNCVLFCVPKKIKAVTFYHNCLIIKWAQKGSNLRPPDYESGALTS